ncbi:serine/threonine-protein kinase PknK [Desulfococcaceae bacterium HSG9]|nr:serine/threonine-protein kinase PknK [Desulfococcaceae bacterium HSG9]
MMLKIPGYTIQSQIYESACSLVYRARRDKDDLPVILKLLKEDYPTPEEIIRYRQEYDITRNLKDATGVIGVYGLENYQKTFLMILEDFDAESLSNLMKTGKTAPDDFLEIGIRIAAVLGEIHKADIIHKDINPSNIVMNPETGEIKIIDFGISTTLSRENPAVKNPNVLEGTLAYISPEQTGRMNRSLDYRTDLYSLGATFYELLTGSPPFVTDDAMKLVHSHIAKIPASPCEKDRKIPESLSAIVMKLLAKNAEDRYQSAWGLKADLEECLNQLRQSRTIAEFPLARRDIADRFQVPQKLYGCEREIDTLLEAFDRVSRGAAEMMLVAGYSGIGKTVLVKEINKPVTRQRGYFISGKFDQLHKRPYSALIQAFKELITQLLTETDEQLNRWKEKLLATLGPNGQVMIDVLPELELVIGPQPDAAKLPPEQERNRFNLVFQNFINVFTQPEHPLVIFIDDLQWIDSASLNLIKMNTTPDRQYLLFIGAYRDNEVSDAHPLMLTLNEIRKTGAIVNQIAITPLNLSHINLFIAGALKCTPERAEPLAELVLAKTDGNPFFMGEFLKTLYMEDLLEFDYEKGRWQWDYELIQVKDITANVVTLMAERIQRFKKETQQVLRLAACIGNKFDLEKLAIIYEKPQNTAATHLNEAVAEGLVIENRNLKSDTGKSERDIQNPDFKFEISSFQYKFAHDRIQQAAYSLIPESERPAIHLKIGRLMLKNTPSGERELNIIETVDQLNLGRSLIHRQSERDELAELNLTAGKTAKASAAYEQASMYLITGKDQLAEDSWQHHYNLTLEMYVEAAEAAYLNGDYEQMELLAQITMQYVNTLLVLCQI